MAQPATKEEEERRAALAAAERKKSNGAFGNVVLLVGVLAMGLTSFVGKRAPLYNAPLEVVSLEHQSFFTTVVSVSRATAYNGPETVWAVFFYKEYCGACRRVRPFFHALAETTNATTKLRFAEIECVKYRHICKHAGAKSQPMIKLFGLTDTKQKLKEKVKMDGYGSYFERKEVATWQGVLIAYEVFGWFLTAQANTFISNEVVWPSDDALALATQAFKKKNDQTYEKAITSTPKNPGQYLESVNGAWRMSLHDAVFMRHDFLSGDPLMAMRDWIDALAYALPKKQWRTEAAVMKEALTKDTISEPQFQSLLKNAKILEPDLSALSCGSERGTKAYLCALWTLFHSLLANADRYAAPKILKTIHGFIIHFFGCTDCARHFDELFLSENGQDVTDAFDANTWLWRAHNLVNKRLDKKAWPSNTTCAPCFRSHHLLQEKTQVKKNHRKKKTSVFDDDLQADPGLKDHLASLETYDPDFYDLGYVFQFLAETYCFDSDTFVCAAFDDPTSNTNFRTKK